MKTRRALSNILLFQSDKELENPNTCLMGDVQEFQTLKTLFCFCKVKANSTNCTSMQVS